MPTPFAARESRLNAAVFKHLANAAGVLDGESVDGIFDDEYVTANVGVIGMASSGPAFTLPTALVPSGVEGVELVVRGNSYTVQEHRPDGAGSSVLLLSEGAPA